MTAKALETGINADSYSVDVSPCSQKQRLILDDELLTCIDGGWVVLETNHASCLYLPRAEVEKTASWTLIKSETVSFCPFKGNATHYHLKMGTNLIENACWSYENPPSELAPLKNHVSFYPDKITTPDFIPTEPETTLIKDDLLSWVVLKAPFITSLTSCIEEFFEQILKIIPSLSHFRISLKVIHPQIRGLSYLWTDNSRKIEVIRIDHDVFSHPSFINSPIKDIFAGKGGIRAIAPGHESVTEAYPVLQEFRERGYKDYCALPIIFTGGEINVLTIASRRLGEMTTASLGSIFQSLQVFSSVIEKYIVQQNLDTFLQTYLGRIASKEVMSGQMYRGEGRKVRGVIAYSDLRQSTQMINQLTTPQFLASLNQYFDCVAQSFIDRGGEVIHYIGDALLCMIPVSSEQEEKQACDKAIAAAKGAIKRIEILGKAPNNQELAVGISLHLGNCVFGNIGVPTRLEFTTIGSCINKAVRIEGLCKTLQRSLLFSEEFSEKVSEPLESLGSFQLRGFSEKSQLFGLLNPSD